jgi:hypothetical protein
MLSLTNVSSHDNGAANIRLYSDKPDEYSYDVNGVVSYNGGEDDVIATINEDTDYTNHSDVPILSDSNYLVIGGKAQNKSGKIYVK